MPKPDHRLLCWQQGCFDRPRVASPPHSAATLAMITTDAGTDDLFMGMRSSPLVRISRSQ
jgi:hypothetical protein